jgi:SpoVK/Ycf46/Vps4 family AAA+-type ATPase
MTNLSITAPAKINLFLHVVGQRSDGYHLLQSVFQLIDLSDEVILSRREDGDIIRQNPLPNIPPESDLVVRAAKLLQTFSKTPLGANIDLIKNIPIGAGLGGGHDEREQTLNQMLAEMDGFEATEGIVVLAATNRPDILDAALLRPGRIDRKVEFPHPNEEARLSILQIHSRRMNLMRGINLKKIAGMIPSSNGAECKAVCTEAGMFAIRAERDYVIEEDFMKAVRKVGENKKLEGKLEYSKV